MDAAIVDRVLRLEQTTSVHLIAEPLADLVIGRRVQAEGIVLRRQDGEIAEIDAAVFLHGSEEFAQADRDGAGATRLAVIGGI